MEPVRLGRLRTTSVVHERPGPASITRNAAFTYHANGLLATETVEPQADASIRKTTAYGYDDFGNRTTTTLCSLHIPDCANSSIPADTAPVWEDPTYVHRRSTVVYDRTRRRGHRDGVRPYI